MLQEKVFGSRGPGRRRLKNPRTWYSKTEELFSAAVNKVVITMMIANIEVNRHLQKNNKS